MAMGRDEIYILTEKIVTACIETVRTGKTTLKLSPRQEVIIKLVHQKIREYPQFFESSCADLKLTPTNFNSVIVQVWDGIFEDGVVNWGRVVSFLAFCSYVCLHSQRIGLPGSVIESIPHWAAVFVNSRLKDWIEERGGWVSLFVHPLCNVCISMMHAMAYAGQLVSGLYYASL